MNVSTYDPNIFYRNAVTRLTSSLDIGQTLQRFLTYIEAFMPADIIQIHLWQADLGAIRILATANKRQIHEPNELIPVEQVHRDIPEWHQNENVKIVNDINEDPISILIQNKVSSWYRIDKCSHLIMRVQIEGERICDIAILAQGGQQFNSEHAHMLELLHDPFAIAVSNVLRHRELEIARNQLATRNDYLREELDRFSSRKIIGENLGLAEIMLKVDQVSHTDAPVLLMGETGVGKDIIAQTIYDRSRRHDRPFIRVNCGAIPETLLNSELFGHEKGAFTDAQRRHLGYFERAQGGTIFLDEIGELSLSAQVMLLRVIQNKEFERVGGSQVIKTDVRLIAATNRDLTSLIDSGQFRNDLYYRLSVFPIKVPALRERVSDIPLLVDHILKEVSQRMNIFPPRLCPGAIDRLASYDWPGNVRELNNVIEHEIIRNPKGPIDFKHITQPVTNRSETRFFPTDIASPIPLEEVNRYAIFTQFF